MINLTEDERSLLQCWLDAWASSGESPAGMSLKAQFEFAKRLGLDTSKAEQEARRLFAVAERASGHEPRWGLF